MIPSKEHWEQAWTGLDEAYAFDHFYGKTLQEAEDMIHDVPTYYCDDFLWMPKVPFQFYLKAFKRYLLSSRSRDNSHAAFSFIVLIRHIIEFRCDWIEGNWQSISKVLNRLADQQDFYDVFEKPRRFRRSVNRIIEKAAQKGINI